MSYAYLRESYNTSENYLKTNNPKGNPVLKREPSEQKKEYDDRLDRCPIRNHIGLIVDRYNSSAIKADVERDSTWNGLYSNYESLFHEALKEAQIVGSSYLVCSLNNANRQSEVDLKLFIVAQDSVVNYLEGELFAFSSWENNKFNELAEFTIIYKSDGTWVKIDGKKDIVDSGVSGFKELPVIKMNPQFPGISQVGLLAPIQESLINLLSIHMEESLQSTFTRHLISGLSDIPQTYEAEQQVQRMISGKKLLLFKDAVTVTNLAADVGQAQNLLTAIEQTENMLYAVAGMRLSEPVKESGLAKQIEQEQFNDIKSKLVNALSRAENSFMSLLMRAFGVSYETSVYNYQTFNPTWSDRISELKELLSLGLSEEFYNKVKQEFERSYLLDENKS